jgi:hypothetical protein
MIPAAPESTATGAPRPSTRSLLLKELTRMRDEGVDITSRKISAVLARQYGCSRALVIGARRTVLEDGHSSAFDELRSHFVFQPQGETR